MRTLSNAFETGRIPQAWMLTGVRGVGKTTTARILARGLNYERRTATGQARPSHAALGVHCEAIMDRATSTCSRWTRPRTPASTTSARSPTACATRRCRRATRSTSSTRCTCSPAAFNAFLKTLEEPPPHAKFVFATTEIRKVPVTILSRCQRFDLRRVEADKLVAHLGAICARRGRGEPEALAAIARAAEGSVRDPLSLARPGDRPRRRRVAAETVRDMLGLADRAQVIDLFEAVMRGDVPAPSRPARAIRRRRRSGRDPVRSRLLHPSRHAAQARAGGAKDPGLTEAERGRGAEFAQTLSISTLRAPGRSC